MKFSYATISKTGRRSNNEDAFNVIDMPEKGRWMGIVCDGMGGHAKGEVASETVVTAISEYWEKFSDMYDREEKVVKACQKASAIFDRRSSQLHAQMGTTMVMASIEGNMDSTSSPTKVTIAHVGDSRCYLIRPGHYDYEDINNTDKDHVLYQTKDHVNTYFGWETVAKCFFSYSPEVADPDIVQFEILPGDRIFLCSDGLYKCIAPNILKERLMEDKAPEEILGGLDLLCERNANDNYTAIMIRID